MKLIISQLVFFSILFFSIDTSAQVPLNLKSKCVSGNCNKGFGRIEFSNGEYYEGEFVGKKLNGKGEYHYANGDVYKGYWTENYRNGTGSYTTAQSPGTEVLEYSGEWYNGMMDGKGSLLFIKDKKNYAYELKDGKFEEKSISYYNENYTVSFNISEIIVDKKETGDENALSICEAFDLLVNAAPSRFEVYKGEKLVTPDQSIKYATSLKIKGAVGATIDVDILGNYSFNVDFGSYPVSQDANTIANNLKAEMVKCKNGNEIFETYEQFTNYPNYSILYKYSTGAKLYNAYFKKRRIDDKFKISFVVNSSNNYKEYVYLTNSNEKSTEINDMRKIIKARETDFNDFKVKPTYTKDYLDYYKEVSGEEMDTTLTHYNSNFLFFGFKDCSISIPKKRSPVGTIYKVNILKNVSDELATSTMNKIADVVTGSLGKGYVKSTTQDGLRIAYSLNADLGQDSKEFVVISKTRPLMGKCSCMLEVIAPKIVSTQK